MRALVLAAVLASAGAARAADMVVVVKTPAGQPVREAVVTFRPAAGAPHGPIKFPWPLQVAQQNKTFAPFVLIAPVGAEVGFPNRDPFRHHVYSFSPAKKFELKLYAKDETRTVKFDKVGVVALGCNIHDQMVGFVKVVDTPYAAKTDADGRAVLPAVPAGKGVLTVWHPYLKAPNGEIDSPAAAGDGPVHQAIVADMRPAPAR